MNQTTPTTTTSPKVYENRIRRIAKRRGYKLTKSRTRDPKSLDYGRYILSQVNYAPNFRAFVLVTRNLAHIESWLAK